MEFYSKEIQILRQSQIKLALDYVNTVVHVFLDKIRDFYQLEELWNDAHLTEHNAVKTVMKPVKRKK